MPLAILCGCRARFVSDMVGNPEDRFSHTEAQMIKDMFMFHISTSKHVVYTNSHSSTRQM